MTNGLKRALWLSALCISGLGSLPVQAAYQELEGIVAIVEDDVVLASELSSRLQQVVQQMKANNVALPPDSILVSQIMERLILESLQRQEAQRRGVDIDDETLTRAVQEFARSNGMTLAQFQQALANDGVSYREFREDIRSELMITRLQRNLINRRISISEQEIQGLLNSPYYQELFADEYRVGHILLSLEERASDDVVRRAMQSAQEIVEELRNGADFAQMAIAKSSSSRALEGGDLGWRRAGALPSLFAEDVLAMEVGDIAEPIRSSGAIHIIKLLEQRGASMQRMQQTKVRHILVKPSEIRTPQETEALIKDIRQQLVDGADFEALAKEYSEDPGTALNGGDLDWSNSSQFDPAFGAAMDATETGALSEPVQSQYGWHVLRVDDRREEDMSDEARENMALEILHKRRFEEEQQEWLKELRDEAFVEVRLNR